MKYKDAGVDIDRESIFIHKLVSQLTFKREKYASLNLPRHFTGLVDMGDYYLAMNTDGVGTKVMVANQMRKWDTIGVDCIGMNVNDTICVGAEPIAFVDYLAISEYDEEIAEQIGRGLNEGAKLANVNIVGGETATIPELVNGLDLSGTSVGIVSKASLVTGDKISTWDLIMGIPSSGIHSNGLTLARKVLDLEEKLGGRSVGEELLIPTRIYVRDVLRVLEKCEVHGLVHITGGGLKNFMRLKKMHYVIDTPLKPQKIFEIIMERGNVDLEEMYRTYNMGMGFALIVPEECEHEIKREIEDVRVVGHVEFGSSVEIPELGVSYSTY